MALLLIAAKVEVHRCLGKQMDPRRQISQMIQTAMQLSLLGPGLLKGQHQIARHKNVP